MLCKFIYSGLINILVQAQVMILWGFLDALTKFLSTVRVWIGSIVGTLIFKLKMSQIGQLVLPPACTDKNGGSKSGNFGAEWDLIRLKVALLCLNASRILTFVL